MLYYMNEEVAAIIEQMKETTKRRKEAEEAIRRTDIRQCHAYSGYAEIEKLSREVEQHTIQGHILLDDLKRAIYGRILPVIVEVLTKYAGKRMGEITERRMIAELRDKTDCSMYFVGGYGDRYLYINVQPLNEQSYIDWRFPKIEIAYTAPSGERVKIDNKMLPVKPEGFKLQCCRSSSADAAAIADASHKVKEAVSALNSLINEYNAVIPSGIDTISSVYIRL